MYNCTESNDSKTIGFWPKEVSQSTSIDTLTMPTLADSNIPLFSCWMMAAAIRLAIAVSTKERITVNNHNHSTAMLDQYIHGEDSNSPGILMLFAMLDQYLSLMK